ncbi:MAG TPA: hypothetical protein VHP33_24205 [Polyangiaceae bacterium]|nr:hypothetical protein [Polyangiaceae bacterium]
MAELYAPSVRAEEASAAETAAARALAVEGLKLAQSNNCAEAVPKLERAEKLYHSTVVASRLGECYVSVGRLVEGTEVLRKVLREPPSAQPTPALTKALERAQRTLEAATPRIAGLTIKVAAVQDMRIKLDGNVVPSALFDSEVPTDPGEHSIEVTAPGFLKSTLRLSVSDGEKKSATLTLARDPNAPAPPVASADPAASSATASSPSSAAAPTSDSAAGPTTASARAPNRTAAYVSLGIGAAGVAAGGVLGFLTMQKHNDLKGDCPSNLCSPTQQGDLDSAKRLGNMSTVAFGVGGAGLVLGTVLFFTAGPSNVDRASSAPRPRFAGLSSPRVAVGPTSIELGADF